MKSFVLFVLVGIVQGTDLKVSWSDCGDANTIAKITSFTPGTVTLGKEETLTGTGSVGKDVSGGSFNINLKAGVLIHETFTGDICKAKSFHLPLNTGTVTWDGMTCPQAKGNAAVSLKIQLAAALPASLAAAVIEAKAKTSSGDDLLCMEVKTTPALTTGVLGGQCNDDDQKAINALDGGNAKGSFPEINSECGKQAYSIFSGFSNATFIKCFTKEIQARESCAACYAAAAEYGVDNCKSKCIFSWCSEGCLDCSKPNSGNVDACAGFTAPQPSVCDSEEQQV